jgi:hypothetical protein
MIPNSSNAKRNIERLAFRVCESEWSPDSESVRKALPRSGLGSNYGLQSMDIVMFTPERKTNPASPLPTKTRSKQQTTKSRAAVGGQLRGPSGAVWNSLFRATPIRNTFPRNVTLNGSRKHAISLVRAGSPRTLQMHLACSAIVFSGVSAFSDRFWTRFATKSGSEYFTKQSRIIKVCDHHFKLQLSYYEEPSVNKTPPPPQSCLRFWTEVY